MVPCRLEDVTELETILKASPEAAAWSSILLKEACEEKGAHLLVAWQGNEITGFVSGRRVADEAEILNLAVKPEKRRGGVGRALVDALLEVFKREGATHVYLEVRQSNTGGIAFYEGLSFRQVGRREHYYQAANEAALILGLTLSANTASH
jgi:[ribosomal protein S18]-alanine N-acetyltransferase